jgi:hypothetical protein
MTVEFFWEPLLLGRQGKFGGVRSKTLVVYSAFIKNNGPSPVIAIVVPAAWEAEAGGFLDSKSSGQSRQHRRPWLFKKKKKEKNTKIIKTKLNGTKTPKYRDSD